MKTEPAQSKKNLITTLKIASVLLVIALISAGILGLLNEFTQIDQDAVFKEKLAGVYKTDAGFEDVGADAANGIYQAYKALDGTKTLVMVAEGSGAYKSTLQILIVITDSKIGEIAQYQSKETPGLGSNVFKEEYLNRYKGADVSGISSFVVTKKPTGAENEIDAVSGATKSSNAVAGAVNKAVAYYKNYYSADGGMR